jgi:hypothetical protein
LINQTQTIKQSQILSFLKRSFVNTQSLNRSLTIRRFHSRFRLRSFRRSKISVQRTLIAGKIEATEAMTPEGMYFIMPMRKSYDQETIKPLRPSRDFRKLPEYYAFKDIACDGLQNLKISTYVNARLYVCETSSNSVTEYMVINDSQDVSRPLFSPKFSQINFRNVKNDKESLTAIPCEYGKTYELFYSDIPIPIADDQGKLNDEIAGKFRTDNINYVKIEGVTCDNDKLQCVRHQSILYSLTQDNLNDDKKRKNIAKGQNETDDCDYTFDDPEAKGYPHKRKVFASAKQLEEAFKNKSSFCVAAIMDDPIGEIEDLYNDYEFSFKYRYAHNKPAFDALREKNAYAYEIARLFKYLYVDKNRQEKYKKKIAQLRDKYLELKSYIYNSTLGQTLLSQVADYNLSPLTDLDLGRSYYQEIVSLEPDFYKGYYDASLYFDKRENVQYTYSAFVSKNEATRSVYRSHTIRFLHFKDPKFDVLSAQEKIASFIFSVAYGAKHADLRERYPAFQTLCDEFYSLFRSIKRIEYPNVSQTTIEEIAEKLEDQQAYKELFKDDPNSLINEYEAIDAKHRLFSFRGDKTDITFNRLSYGKNKEAPIDTFGNHKMLPPPSELIKKIQAKLNDNRFKKTLKLYEELYDNLTDDDNIRLMYADFFAGLLYNLIVPRAIIDQETDPLSPFSDNNAHILSAIIKLSKRVNDAKMEDETGVTPSKITLLPIWEKYFEALQTLCVHAEYKGKPYKENMERFFSEFVEPKTERPNRQQPKQRTPFDVYFDDKKDEDLYEERFEAIGKIAGLGDIIDDTLDKAIRSDESGGVNRGNAGGKNNQLQPAEASQRIGATPTRYEDPASLRHTSTYTRIIATAKGVSLITAFHRMTNLPEDKPIVFNAINIANDTILIVNLSFDLIAHGLKELGLNITRPETLASLEHALKLDRLKIISPARMNMFVRYGIVGAVSNAVYNLITPPANLENNKAYYAVTIIKDVAGIALMFCSGFVGLGIYVAIEVIWYLWKHKLENSNIELYIEKSLFYQEMDYRSPNSRTMLEKIFIPKTDLRFVLDILSKTIEESNKNKSAENQIQPPNKQFISNSTKRLTAYLADLHEQDINLYKVAFRNEIAALFQAIKDYGIETEGADGFNARIAYIKDDTATLSTRSLNVLKLSPSLSKDAKRFIMSFYANHAPRYKDIPQPFISLDKDGQSLIIDITKALLSETTITEAAEFAFDKNKAFKIKQSLNNASEFKLGAYDISDLAKAILKNASLFAIVKDEKTQIHKYNVIYSLYSRGGGRGGSMRVYIEIDKCKPSVATSDDLKELEKMNVEIDKTETEGQQDSESQTNNKGEKQ